MLVIFNKGKVKIRKLGNVATHECSNCKTVGLWDLRLFTKSFTLFFIPIVTYEKIRYVACPNCDSCIELNRSQFNEMHKSLPNYKSNIITDLFWKFVTILVGISTILTILSESTI